MAREGIGGHVIVVGVVVGGVDDDVDVDDNGPESANVARRIGTVEGSEREREGVAEKEEKDGRVSQWLSWKDASQNARAAQ